MLPHGAVADLAGFQEQQALKSVHPEAQTVARLLLGRCSCDFVRPRVSDAREDERHLRERYRRLGLERPLVIRALERHRQEPGRRSPPEGWPDALAKFVAEHARNAGPTLYHLDFSPIAAHLSAPADVRRVTVSEVLAGPERWLKEGSPALVSR
jgi:hypothetical protein